MSNSSALSMATATTSANRSARRRGRDLGGRPVLTVRGPVSAQVPWRVLILNVALVVRHWRFGACCRVTTRSPRRR